MPSAVHFQGESVEIPTPPGRSIQAWNGPLGADPADLPRMIREALESPRDFPPLRQAVVPGDRVVIPFGRDVPEPDLVLAAVCDVLESAGIERGSITILAEPEADAALASSLPKGVVFARHDPEDRNQIAYLATTSDERRIYLSRLLTDADFVLPVGRVAYDPWLGLRGPWSLIFPAMSDVESRQSAGERAGKAMGDRARSKVETDASAEVGWLLGTHFQVGIVPGVTGVVEVLAGLGASVLEAGGLAVDGLWTVKAADRAELVIAGVGSPGQPADLDAVARALATSIALVRRGGKIAVLSRASGALGPATRRLADADNPRLAANALRGQESQDDYPIALQFARALAWADIYLLSALPRDEVEDIAVIALDRPEEAARLAAISESCLLVSQADRVRVQLDDEAE